MGGVYAWTVCGLRVVPGTPAERWHGYSTWTTAGDVLSAYSFAQMDVQGDVSTDGQMSTDLAFACAHEGHVDTAGALALATDTVTAEHIEAERLRCRRAREPYGLWTVCGIDRSHFLTFCLEVEAWSWMLAWVDACDQVRALGAAPLTARVHPGSAPAVFDDKMSGYADPLAWDDETMRATVTDKWGQP